jgi:hypothetical protein
MDMSKNARTLAEVLDLCKTEPRASHSASMDMMYQSWRSGIWREDKCLRALMVKVFTDTIKRGICEGMTDAESDQWLLMARELENA